MITFVIITKEDTGSNRFLKLSPTKSKGALLDTNFFEELAFPSKKQNQSMKLFLMIRLGYLSTTKLSLKGKNI